MATHLRAAVVQGVRPQSLIGFLKPVGVLKSGPGAVILQAKLLQGTEHVVTSQLQEGCSPSLFRKKRTVTLIIMIKFTHIHTPAAPR